MHEHTHDAHGLRTPFSAYGVGLVHGVGGSGGITLLLLSTIEEPSKAVVALLIFAAGTAVSMALLLSAFGLAIAAGPLARNFERVAPECSGCLPAPSVSGTPQVLWGRGIPLLVLQCHSRESCLTL